jgi:hypothetical protein
MFSSEVNYGFLTNGQTLLVLERDDNEISVTKFTLVNSADALKVLIAIGLEAD